MLDPFIERRLRDVHQLPRLGRLRADDHRQRRIGDKSPICAPKVEAHDVPVLNHALAGNPVHDLLVHGYADRRRIAVIAEERRHDVMLLELAAYDLVQLLHDEPRA